MERRCLRSNSNKSERIKRKRISCSKRANLKFPVGRIHRHLRKGRYADRISDTAPVYLTAVIEYLTSEVLELASNIALDDDRKEIEPRDINFAIKLDPEFYKFAANITIPNSEKNNIFRIVN